MKEFESRASAESFKVYISSKIAEPRSTPAGRRDFKVRFRAKREQLERVHGLLPESQGQNLALTVLYVLWSRDSGLTDEHLCPPQGLVCLTQGRLCLPDD